MDERRIDRRPAAAGRIVFAAVAAALLAPPAHAQLAVRVDAGGGVALPLAPSAITDLWNTGFTLSGAFRARLGSRLALGPEIEYARFGFDADAFEATIADSFPNVNAGGNDLFVVSILLDAEYALVDWGNTRPYARGGLGWAHAAVTDPTASGPNAARVRLPDPGADGVALRLGVGVRTLVTPVITLFADAGWQIAWLDPDPVQFVPIRVGLRF